MKELFNKPKWLKPELNIAVYWVHLVILLAVVYILMQWKNPGTNYLLWLVYLAAGDLAAHTSLGLD